MKHRPPPFRHWKFKGEEFSPFELKIRNSYRNWRDFKAGPWLHEVRAKKRALGVIERIAKAYNINLENV